MTYWSGYVSCHMAITMTMTKNKKSTSFCRGFSDKENIGFI